MPLLAFWSSNPDAVAEFSIEQIVSAAGDGNLKDGSVCSQELREYLSKVPITKLASYVERCLSSAFPRSGLVLQDLVNELGRRLDYEATDGRYQGVSNAIGFDGLWQSPEGHTLVIEVKTTDAYRISLNTLVGYREQLRAAEKISGPASILIIVGRQDTGELEAQIRGSRHAWDVRLISAEALIKLAQLKQESDEPETGSKMRSLLTPLEYTRLDQLVDVMFTTVTDVETPIDQTEKPPAAASRAEEGKSSPYEFTSESQLKQKRQSIISALEQRERTPLIQKSRALFWSPDHDVRAACSISKRYTKKGAHPYWYAYHPQWDEFLRGSDRSFFILGCMDLDYAFAIPREVLAPLLQYMNTTTREDGKRYWHIHIVEPEDGLEALVVPKQGQPFPLKSFRLPLV